MLEKQAKELNQLLADWPKRIKKYKRANHKKAIFQLFNTFLPFLAIWAIAYLSLAWSYWLTLLFTLLAGFFMARIFIIQHDCGHQSFFNSSVWNNRVGFFCSLLAPFLINIGLEYTITTMVIQGSWSIATWETSIS